MPDLDFQIQGVDSVPYAAAPTLAFKLRIAEELADGQPPVAIHTVILRCQIRIDPGRRRYEKREQDQLYELFGEPSRWGQTVHSMLWTHAAASVPAFTGQTNIDLLVPCTFDFNIAATKYFAGLADGEVPVTFLFSGTIFYAGHEQPLQVEQISWEKEASFRLPVQVWKQMMGMYYPNSAWICVRRDLFDRLGQYKTDKALLSLEHALERLLDQGIVTEEQFTP